MPIHDGGVHFAFFLERKRYRAHMHRGEGAERDRVVVGAVDIAQFVAGDVGEAANALARCTMKPWLSWKNGMLNRMPSWPARKAFGVTPTTMSLWPWRRAIRPSRSEL
ncbi:MAG: hypothetical protein WDN04_11590 [Rhodospirillales bacterium]